MCVFVCAYSYTCMYLIYILQNIILSIVFVPSMLAGGIVNVVYSVDNSGIINPDCLDIDSTDDSAMRDFCSSVSRVYGCEITGGVSLGLCVANLVFHLVAS